MSNWVRKIAAQHPPTPVGENPGMGVSGLTRAMTDELDAILAPVWEQGFRAGLAVGDRDTPPKNPYYAKDEK